MSIHVEAPIGDEQRFVCDCCTALLLYMWSWYEILNKHWRSNEYC